MTKRKTTARGYGYRHQRRRKALAPYVAAGLATCARCGEPIQPGQAWDLDHADDRASYLGPSHQECNRGAKSRPPVAAPRRVSSW